MSGRRTEDTRLLSGLVAGGALLLLTFLASVVVASPARAHTGLVEVAPADGAAVSTAPRQVVLTFASELDRSLAVVGLTGPSGPVDLPSAPEVTGRRVAQEVGALSAGEHRVRFRVVAADGHPVTGETTFTVERGAAAGDAGGAAGDTSGAAGQAPAATTPAGTGREPAASVPPPAATGSGSAAAGLPAAAGAVLVLLVAGLLVLRRPGARAAADDGPRRA